MGRKLHCWRAIFAVPLVLCMAGPVWGQDSAGQAVSKTPGQMKLVQFPGFPKCAPGSVQSGDPAKSPTIIFAKTSTACTVPWHWHSVAEHLMMVKGVARLDSKGGKPITLRSGGYAMLPAKHVHQFVCTSSCEFYVHSEGPFDIHYVNEQGNEISADEALSPARKVASKK